MVGSAARQTTYLFDYPEEFPISRLLLIAASSLLLVSCLEDAPLPELGECGVIPDDVGGYRLADGTSTYEYGQVGIGRCLASPTDLRVVADPADPTNHFVMVLNANARSNFEGSSLLSIDASSIDLTCPTNGLHELDSTALGMQEFAGRMDFDADTGMGLVSARVFGGDDGALNDVVYVVDAQDPRNLSFHDAAPNPWGPYRFVSVPADPWSVRINPWNRTAYVLSLTEHAVHGIDLAADPIQFLDLVPEFDVGDPVFDDADGSGSAPDFELLALQSGLVQDETITLDWQDGTTRLYFVQEDEDGLRSLFQADSGDGVNFVTLSGGPVLEPGGDWAQGGLGPATVSPAGEGLGGYIAGLDADGRWGIGRILAPDTAIDWSLGSTPVLSPEAAWEGTRVTDPEWLTDTDATEHLWYSGGPGLGQGIGHASGVLASLLERDGDPALTDAGKVLGPGTGFDSAAVFAPAVVRTAAPEQFRLYYTGHADAAAAPGDTPAGLAIGLALADAPAGPYVRSDRGLNGTAEVLSAGEAGAWDSAGVAAPAVFRDNGRWYLYYQGWDGATWRTGRAISLDGVSWDKDPGNPIADGVTDADGLPQRGFAWKAGPGGYYKVEGSLTGLLPQDVFEGVDYDSTASPVHLRVVGGQALGRGDAGAVNEDGASSAATANDAGDVLYVGHRGTRRRLAVATDSGAGLSPRTTVELAGFTGGLADLNGAAPDRPVLGVDAATAGSTWVALELDAGIALVQGDLGADAPVLASAHDGLLIGPTGGAEWDGTSVHAPSVLLDAPDGVWRVYYEGRNQDTRAIGVATSADNGATWVQQTAPVFERGDAGTWDDDWVGDPTVIWDAASAQYRMWYRASDGLTQQFGYATSDDGVLWHRHLDASGAPAPVWDGGDLAFADTVSGGQVRATDDGVELWFDATLEDTVRVGRAASADGLSWEVALNPTTHGDSFSFDTREGDLDPASGIFLGDGGRNNVVVDGVLVSGAGASEMVISPDGRWGVVANKRDQFLIVMDLFDDSTDGYHDANYQGIEAAIHVPQVRGMVGMRAMQFSEDGQTLWVTLAPMVIPTAGASFGDGTEALVTFDFSLIQDAPEATAWLDGILTGFLPLARGIEEDKGYTTDTSVGPGGLAVNRAGTRAYVSNFNDNSLYVLDIGRGARGAVLDVIRGLDEMPFDVALSPDEGLVYVANSYGIERSGAQHSTMQVIDVDESSPTYGEILTRLDNLGSRSSCE